MAALEFLALSVEVRILISQRNAGRWPAFFAIPCISTYYSKASGVFVPEAI